MNDNIADCLVITGGSSGIGLSLVKMMCTEIKVIVLDINPLSDSINGGSVEYIKCDVSDPYAVHEAVELVGQKYKITKLFLCAGYHLFAKITETSRKELDDIINTNQKGVFYCLQAVLPIMQKNNCGRIVVMGSDQSHVGKSSSAAYGMTKAAVAQLVKNVAIDYAQYGVRINTICPGTVDTPMLQKTAFEVSQKENISIKEVFDNWNTSQAVSGLIKPKEIAMFVKLMLSYELNGLTGASVNFDGGLTAA
jgi:NAD(P)-dependent dehydrogenase (short-subunit alcohol dehydrogenase family)